MRRSSPMRPTTTSPEFNPMRTAKRSPRVRSSWLPNARSRSRRCSAAWQARCAWSSCAIGAPKSAMMPSPVYWLIVPLETVDPIGEDSEEAVHDLVPLFSVDLLGEIHRAFHVGKENRHLFAFALESAAGSEDLLDEMGGTLHSSTLIS